MHHWGVSMKGFIRVSMAQMHSIVLQLLKNREAFASCYVIEKQVFILPC